MLFLTDEELFELTGKRIPSVQCRVLQTMGIHFIRRPDGKPKIARAWIEGAHHSAVQRQIIALDAIK